MKNMHGETTWFEEKTTSDDREFKNIIIAVDPRRDNLVSVVIHELLHVYFAKRFNIGKIYTPELEEGIILGLERELYNYLLSSKNEKLLESWANAIERKLT